MIKVTATNNVNGAIAHVRAESWDRIRRLVIYFWTAVENALNVSNPRPYKTPSKPGEPPRKRTGFLQANVKYELDKQAMAGRVGIAANAKYGVYLEMGTRWMAARPWLLATLTKILPQLQVIAGQGKGSS